MTKNKYSVMYKANARSFGYIDSNLEKHPYDSIDFYSGRKVPCYTFRKAVRIVYKYGKIHGHHLEISIKNFKKFDDENNRFEERAPYIPVRIYPEPYYEWLNM